MIAHISARFAFVVLGHVAGVATGAAAFALVLTLISLVMPDGGLWDWLGLGPVLMIAVPFFYFFVAWITLVLTAIPAGVTNLITEYFALRALWVHLVMAAAVAVSGGMWLDPQWFDGMSFNKWLITLAIVLAAVTGGLVHWAIAGRNAGLRPEPSA